MLFEGVRVLDLTRMLAGPYGSTDRRNSTSATISLHKCLIVRTGEPISRRSLGLR